MSLSGPFGVIFKCADKSRGKSLVSAMNELIGDVLAKGFKQRMVTYITDHKSDYSVNKLIDDLKGLRRMAKTGALNDDI